MMFVSVIAGLSIVRSTVEGQRSQVWLDLVGMSSMLWLGTGVDVLY